MIKIKQILIGLILSQALYAEDLLVFLPGDIDAAKVQSEISKSTDLNVKAFDKIKDLEKEAETNKSAYIIAPFPYADAEGYDVLMNGYKGADKGEKYMLVTANAALSADGLSDKRLGIYDVMGRKTIKKFLKSNFAIDGAKLKTVNKKEDLLTLLGIDAVDVIVVSEGDLEDIKKTSKVALKVLKQSAGDIGYPVVAAPKGADKGKVASLSKVSKGFLNKFSFDSWRVK